MSETLPAFFGLGIKNFHQVNPLLFRGGQPSDKDYEVLTRLGIKTVISFRWNKLLIQKEAQLALGSGLHFESIPLNYWTFPDEISVQKFFSIVDDPSRQPVFVHCLHGCDRTGLFVALYRVVNDGWDVEAAYEEMRNRGFHKVRMHHFKWALYLIAEKLKNRTTHSIKPSFSPPVVQSPTLFVSQDDTASAKS